MVTSLFVRGICVLVAGTRRSIGDVPLNVIVGTRARQALGPLDRLGRPTLPFTVYIMVYDVNSLITHVCGKFLVQMFPLIDT